MGTGDDSQTYALETLKNSNEIIASSLEKDLLLLQGKHKTLQIDYDQNRSHLMQAIISKDKLTDELGRLREGRPASPESKVDEIDQSALQALKEVSRDKPEGSLPRNTDFGKPIPLVCLSTAQPNQKSQSQELQPTSDQGVVVSTIFLRLRTRSKKLNES